MSGMKDKGFGERLSAARDAKQAMAAKFHQRPRFDDPAVAEQRAARAAVSAAREARLAEREAKRLADNTRIAAEREAHAIAAAAERASEEARTVAEKAESDARLEVERKVARDARYAARKARRK